MRVSDSQADGKIEITIVRMNLIFDFRRDVFVFFFFFFCQDDY